MQRRTHAQLFIQNIISVTKVNWVFYYPKCYISINCKLACEIFETCEFLLLYQQEICGARRITILKQAESLRSHHLGEFKEV